VPIVVTPSGGERVLSFIQFQCSLEDSFVLCHVGEYLSGDVWNHKFETYALT
jgi:hypothetical protein